MTTDNSFPYQQMIGILAEMVTTYLANHGLGRVQFPVVLTLKKNKKRLSQSTEEMIQTLLACQNFGLSFGPLEKEWAC